MVTDPSEPREFAAPDLLTPGCGLAVQSPAVETLARQALQQLSIRVDAVKSQAEQPDAQEIENLAALLMSPEENAALDMVKAQIAAGTDLEDLYLMYLSGAARLIGEWWVENKASFFDVTTSVGRIFFIMEVIRKTRTANKIRYKQELLFASLPSEDHALGVRMATDLFRAQGWDVRMLAGAPLTTILGHLDGGQIGVVGLSASQPEKLGELAQVIGAIRRAQPSVRIMVSGRALGIAAAQIEQLKPDWTVPDIPSAIALMRRLEDADAPATGA